MTACKFPSGHWTEILAVEKGRKASSGGWLGAEIEVFFLGVSVGGGCEPREAEKDAEGQGEGFSISLHLLPFKLSELFLQKEHWVRGARVRLSCPRVARWVAPAPEQGQVTFPSEEGAGSPILPL